MRRLSDADFGPSSAWAARFGRADPLVTTGFGAP